MSKLIKHIEQCGRISIRKDALPVARSATNRVAGDKKGARMVNVVYVFNIACASASLPAKPHFVQSLLGESVALSGCCSVPTRCIAAAFRDAGSPFIHEPDCKLSPTVAQ